MFYLFPLRVNVRSLYVGRRATSWPSPPDGTIDRPFPTIEDAITFVKNGVVLSENVAILIEPGNYPQAITMDRPGMFLVGLVATRMAATRIGPITIATAGTFGIESLETRSVTVGAPAGQSVVFGAHMASMVAGSGAALAINANASVTLSASTITTGSGTALVLGPSMSLTMRQCTVMADDGFGMTVGAGSHVSIEEGSIAVGSGTALQMATGSTAMIERAGLVASSGTAASLNGTGATLYDCHLSAPVAARAADGTLSLDSCRFGAANPPVGIVSGSGSIVVSQPSRPVTIRAN